MIEARQLTDPGTVGPLDFRPRYQPPQRDDRYRIARQNRRRRTGERHPAWLPESGFPSAPGALSGPDDPAIPDLSLLKIVVLRSDDGDYHAWFVNSGARPPMLPPEAEILFQPNAQSPPNGLIAFERPVDVDVWRAAAAFDMGSSRDGLPSAPEIEDALDATARAAGARPRGQGFRQSHPERQAIDRHAMAVAAAHLEGRGWDVEDVSATRSYDLHCCRGDETLHVEVKGTTGDGSAVLLTPNEVVLARDRHPETALLIVSGVELEQDEDDEEPQAANGAVRLITPWDVEASGTLHPTGFRYLLGE